VRVALASTPLERLPVDALAVPVAAGQPLTGAAAELDQRLGGLLSEVIPAEHRGALDEVLTLPTGGAVAARRVLLYGLGKAEDLDGQRLRYAHHQMARTATRFGYRRLAVVCSEPLQSEHLAAVVEGSVMGSWDRRRRQTAEPSADLEELLLSGFGEAEDADLAASQQLAQATNRVRQWQDLPPNELTPEALTRIARQIGERHGLEVDVLGPEELQAGGFELLLGVGAGSDLAPRLVRLQHRGALIGGGRADVRLALVGKGVTFDSGGLSIKTAEQMRTMKGDMAGAAAVLAAVDVIAARRLPLDVMAVVAITENMVGGSAQRPGDIVTSANGKTVEVVNTDAEGRLILADAITYAVQKGATHIVDIATLTGAANVALGHAATLAVANDEELWGWTVEAAERAGDRVWRMPMYPDYEVLLASRVADLKNSYYGEAGAIAAGMFIREFVEGRPWVHLDIAASSWNTNDGLTSIPRGPLGAGTRLLVHLAELVASGHPVQPSSDGTFS
jgi:leucyl aminopeptidase